MSAHAGRQNSLTIRQPSDLRNVGPATMGHFQQLGITTPEQLADQDADLLYLKLSEMRGQPVDPCVQDVFRAAIHQVQSGEALPWWHFSAQRKQRAQKRD